MYLRNKISYIVKMERQGGLIINIGYTTVWYMTQRVSLILKIVTCLLGKVWCKINDTVWAKECDIKQILILLRIKQNPILFEDQTKPDPFLRSNLHWTSLIANVRISSQAWASVIVET